MSDDDDRVLDMPPAKASRRFHQIHRFQREVRKLDKLIEHHKDKLKTLKDRRGAILEELLEAADDQGELPEGL